MCLIKFLHFCFTLCFYARVYGILVKNILFKIISIKIISNRLLFGFWKSYIFLYMIPHSSSRSSSLVLIGLISSNLPGLHPGRWKRLRKTPSWFRRQIFTISHFGLFRVMYQPSHHSVTLWMSSCSFTLSFVSKFGCIAAISLLSSAKIWKVVTISSGKSLMKIVNKPKYWALRNFALHWCPVRDRVSHHNSLSMIVKHGLYSVENITWDSVFLKFD